ncbi:hypothetical protein HPB48_012675 [Haemaphysalis longicornis]|uniref:THAP-type domain-containing protein n=1 Tax=Haemaphysalis longicornis TaxID=44386 RepID=A0A9J6G0B0_HAELO|nr:hypothetical protein HPB48_012675 [Haemaphysalis longicornis]
MQCLRGALKPPIGIREGARAIVYTSPGRASVLAQWRRAIPRTEKRLKENTAVCDLHFGERYISRHIAHTVNGEVVSIYRKRPRFPPEAVPTQFPIFRSTSRNNFPEQEVSSEKRTRGPTQQ